MKAFGRVLTMFGILLLMSFRADAHDPSMANHEWFNKQEMNPAAQQRLGVPVEVMLRQWRRVQNPLQGG